MKQIQFGKTGWQVPAIAAGCMRLSGKTREEMNAFIHASIDMGVTFFEHADIYGGGKSEEIFGEAFSSDSSLKREDVLIQTKCGICKGYFDFSKEHIIEALDGSLKRLKTDYVDVLVLHRPDALVEPEEVAAAFDKLQAAGKVRAFGVSNHNPMQIELLKKYVKQDIQTNQLQFSLTASNMIAQGLEANMDTPGSFGHDGSVLDYSRIHDITIQTWSPFQLLNWKGCFIDHEGYPELNNKLAELAEKYQVTKTSIAAAWILRHPANMQIVAGTASIDRMRQITAACEVSLSRKEWYELYLAAGHILP